MGKTRTERMSRGAWGGGEMRPSREARGGDQAVAARQPIAARRVRDGRKGWQHCLTNRFFHLRVAVVGKYLKPSRVKPSNEKG